MTDHTPSMMEYLLSLTPEQAREAVNSLPPSEKLRLVRDICGVVDQMTTSIVSNAD